MASGLIGKMMMGGPAAAGLAAPAAADLGGPSGGESEGHGTAVDLLNNALDDLKQLAPMLPDVPGLMARLESLRPKAEEYDKGGAGPGEASLDSLPANPGQGPKGY